MLYLGCPVQQRYWLVEYIQYRLYRDISKLSNDILQIQFMSLIRSHNGERGDAKPERLARVTNSRLELHHHHRLIHPTSNTAPTTYPAIPPLPLSFRALDKDFLITDPAPPIIDINLLQHGMVAQLENYSYIPVHPC